MLDARDEKIKVIYDSSCFIETINTKNGTRVDIIRDEFSENPFRKNTTVGKLVARTSGDRFSEEARSDNPYNYAMGDGALIAIPLTAWGDDYHLDESADPDKNMDAVIYATPKSIHGIFGTNGATKKQITESLREELERYCNWANNRVYATNIWNIDGVNERNYNTYDSIEDIRKEWQ